jgi:hypothetical protein
MPNSMAVRFPLGTSPIIMPRTNPHAIWRGESLAVRAWANCRIGRRRKLNIAHLTIVKVSKIGASGKVSASAVNGLERDALLSRHERAGPLVKGAKPGNLKGLARPPPNGDLGSVRARASKLVSG